jgi:HNH endonuclease
MENKAPDRKSRSTPAPVSIGSRSRAWFDQGCDAFKRAFPEIAKNVPADRFYVCPVCLHAFGEEALALRFLTREDVPPKSVGGRKLALTCRQCNSEGGHEVDSHARREADLYDFAAGELREIKAGLITASGRVPIRLSASGRGIQMFGVPAATHPPTHARVMGDFEGATGEGNWQGFTFKVDFPAFSPERARASWLRSGYLAFFATLGYRFIFRPELDVVRAKIRNPKLEDPRTFRIIRPESSAPALIRIERPEVFRSYAMFYGRNVVFLPRYGDHGLYARLAEHPETTVSMSGIQYPWPTNGPTFFHDRPAE